MFLSNSRCYDFAVARRLLANGVPHYNQDQRCNAAVRYLKRERERKIMKFFCTQVAPEYLEITKSFVPEFPFSKLK